MKFMYWAGILFCCSFDVSAIGWFGTALNGKACNGGGQGFGPYDYLQVVAAPKGSPLYQNARLWEVDKIHYGKGLAIFNSKELNQVTIKQISSEYNYTIRAFPNHINALYAIIKLELRRIEQNKRLSNKLPTLKTPPECYLKRALVFRPKQAHIHLLYAFYLQSLSLGGEAKLHYRNALKLDPHNGEAHYNYGLLLYRMGEYAEATEHAKRAMELHYPQMGLKNMLVADGKWDIK